MGAHTDYVADATLEETLKDGTTVAAATGFCVLDERYPDQSPEPVIAWRVGNDRVLPITRCGVVCRECFVVYPDGRVRHHHGSPYGSWIPEFASVAEWRESDFGPKRPDFGRHPVKAKRAFDVIPEDAPFSRGALEQEVIPRT